MNLNIAISGFITLIIGFLVAYVFKRKTNQKLDQVKTALKTYENSVNKLVNVTYISELEKLEIKDLDNNICTIITEKDLSKTDKVKLVGLLCKNLNLEIEHLNVNNTMFLSCFKKECYSALILDNKNMTITCQDFNFLLLIHAEISKLLKIEFSNEIKETKNN